MTTLKHILRYLRYLIIRSIAILNGKKLNNLDNVLIISPHPDDEIFGCGGLVYNLNLQKKIVNIIFLTRGENAESKISPKILREERTKLAKKTLLSVHQSLDHVFFLDFIDGEVDIQNPETEKLKRLIDQIHPNNIFVPHIFDGHDDHAQSNIIIRSLIIDKHIKLYEYCVWLWYSMPFKKVFSINWRNERYLKMEKDTYRFKKEAIKLYLNEADSEGNPYSGNLPRILISSCSQKKEIYFLNKRLQLD
jgi:LmbE family N-acetylglucosaminyl deacetylase